MAEAQLVFGGMPTKFDVEALEKAFSNHGPGDIIEYTDMEKVLGMARDTFRFKTVLYAWRRKLYRERNLMLGPIRNRGYQVLTNVERVSESIKDYKGGLKKVRRAGEIAMKTDRHGLSEDSVKQLEHVGNRAAILWATEATEARKLRFPDPEVRRLVSSN